ncbi:MAG: PKD domain-containing protein, partial [Flavobacteriales bacterium]
MFNSTCKHKISFLLVFISVIGINLRGYSQPANNTCENATDITSDIGGSDVCSNDNGATNDGDDGGGTACVDEYTEVWYKFTAPSSGEIAIENTSYCGGDQATMTLYSGNCGGGLAEIECNDYGSTNPVLMNLNLTGGDTYYLRVDNENCEGDFCINISDPPNEGNCVDSAKVIDACGTSFTMNNKWRDDCGRDCGNSGTCGGGMGWAGSDWDFNCSTCGNCSDGCEIDGSTENNAFWTFTPGSSCDYDVTFETANCIDGSGIQYGIFDYNGTNITKYHVSDGNGNNGTWTETITVTSGTEVIIGIDGLAGDICDVSITVDPVNCGSCTIGCSADASFTTNDTAQCYDGNSFDFTNSGSSGSGWTYEWDFESDGTVDATTENVSGHSYSSPGTYTVSHVVDSSGCKDSVTQTVLVKRPTSVVDSLDSLSCANTCDGAIYTSVSDTFGTSATF